MDIRKESLKKHYEWNGKIEVVSRVPINSAEDLSLAYTPGVAEPCLEIQKDYDKSFELTRRNNLVAVVTDGTAVLGLGDIGPEAGMPVMEGKCALFKEFGDVDAFPICVRSKDVDEIVNAIYLISGSFGGINLEDIICKGDPRLNAVKQEMAEITNLSHLEGSLADAMKGADVFLGISAAGCVSEEMVKSMAKDPILFAMANPTPEIMPDIAKKAGAAVVGTGRSDFPNQINNVLAFPGIFRGALDCRASDINEEMKVAASFAIASLVSDEELNADYILPEAFDKRIGKTVAEAVKKAAIESGVARI